MYASALSCESYKHALYSFLMHTIILVPAALYFACRTSMSRTVLGMLRHVRTNNAFLAATYGVLFL